MQTAESLSGLPYGRCTAVLFDLDGTLIDTAPDMVSVLTDMQTAAGDKPLDYALARSHVSNGALGLLRIGFPNESEESYERLKLEFLSLYQKQLSAHSRIFPGIDTLLSHLEEVAVPWGVVTNKPAHLTDPLLVELGLAERSSCNVSGDTLAVRKPDPAPLLHACEIAGVDASTSIFVGDAQRDIEAGQRAGMATIAAGYGYIVDSDDAHSWGADRVVDSTQELAHEVLKAVTLNA